MTLPPNIINIYGEKGKSVSRRTVSACCFKPVCDLIFGQRIAENVALGLHALHFCVGYNINEIQFMQRILVHFCWELLLWDFAMMEYSDCPMVACDMSFGGGIFSLCCS